MTVQLPPENARAAARAYFPEISAVIRPSTLCTLVLALVCGFASAQDVLAEARKAIDAKEYAKALELLEEAYDDVKGNKVGMGLLAESALKAGRFGRAIEYAAKFADMDAENPAAHRLGALAFYWRAEEAKAEPGATPGKINGLYEESKGFNKVYLKLKAKDVEMWSVYGYTLYWLEEHEESAAAFSEAAKLDPKNADHFDKGARAYRLAGKFDEAVATLDKLIATDPENAALIKLKADAVWFKADATKDDAGYRAAAAVYAAALAAKNLETQTAGECTNVLWSIYGNNKDFDEAIGHIKGWAKAHPSDPSPHWWEGWYQRQKNDEAAALAAYTRCWEVSGKKWATGAVGIAEQHWRLAYPKDANGAPNFSARPTNVDELEKAVTWFCKAQAVPWNWGSPDQQPIQKCITIFMACANSGNLDRGAGMLEKQCLKVAPDNWHVLNNLGLYYRDLGGQQRDKKLCVKSKDYYVRASEIVVKDPQATNESKARVLNDTGVLFHFPQYQIRDMETGIKYYMRAIKHKPASVADSIGWLDANENMGICMNALGKYEEAVPYLKMVLKYQPNRRVSLRELRRAESAIKDK